MTYRESIVYGLLRPPEMIFVEGGAVKRKSEPFVAQELLTPAEVAEMFAVEPKTVTRWARDGKVTSVRTLGGHRRFPADQIRRLREESTTEMIEDGEPS